MIDKEHMSDYMTGKDLRKALGISTATYYRWLREGKLHGTRAGRDWRFTSGVLDELLRSGALSPALQAACDAYARRLRTSKWRYASTQRAARSWPASGRTRAPPSGGTPGGA